MILACAISIGLKFEPTKINLAVKSMIGYAGLEQCDDHVTQRMCGSQLMSKHATQAMVI